MHLRRGFAARQRRTSARSARHRARDGGARRAEVIRLVWRLWAEQDGRVLRPSWISAGSRLCRGRVRHRDRQRLLVALGFLGPIGPALMISVMIVAMITVHWEHGLFAANQRRRGPAALRDVAIGLALIGFGHYSVDALLGSPTDGRRRSLCSRWPSASWAASQTRAIRRRAPTTAQGSPLDLSI